jgi:hypothetical protein
MHNQMRSLPTGILLCVLLLNISGCCTAKGLVKTQLINRKRVSYPSLGITLELPKNGITPCKRYLIHVWDGRVFQTNAHLRAVMLIGMHPVWTGPMTEPLDLLELYIARTTPDEFAKFLMGKQVNLNRVFGEQLKAFQSEVTSYVMHERHGPLIFLVFRKDIRLPGGDIVVAGARLVNNGGVVPDKEEDIRAITEILNSIQPLNRP